MPEVSIIMANFNGAAFLGDAVASVRAQTLQDWELIVVDDASDDDSWRILAQAARADPRIRILRQVLNQGPANARNRALAEARGQWIGIFDSDDVMKPERLERLTDAARRLDARILADNQDLCSSRLAPERQLLSRADLRQLDPVDLASFIDSSRLYSSLPDLGYLKPFVRADLIAETGARYDENLRIGEDFHFVVRLLSSGARLHLLAEPLYCYRRHGSSISHRLSPQIIASMIAADEGFAKSALPLSVAAHRALARRIRGLRSWAVHERAMQAFKERRFAAGLSAAVSRPHAWPLILRPIGVRLARVWRTFSASFRARRDGWMSVRGRA